jgi:hypothetical protein
VWSLLTLLALAVVGAAYQAIVTQIDQRSISPAPGQMVSVGNHQLTSTASGRVTLRLFWKLAGRSPR